MFFDGNRHQYTSGYRLCSKLLTWQSSAKGLFGTIGKIPLNREHCGNQRCSDCRGQIPSETPHLSFVPQIYSPFVTHGQWQVTTQNVLDKWIKIIPWACQLLLWSPTDGYRMLHCRKLNLPSPCPLVSYLLEFREAFCLLLRGGEGKTKDR